MAAEIGQTLREARSRRKIDLVQVETDTKIRVRYLRALENEEWDVLPGGAYTRSFIRTYATYLGLDAERLADDYRRAHEDPAADSYPRAEPVAPGRAPRAARGGETRFSRGAVAVLITVGLIVVLIALGLAEDDDGSSPPAPPPADQPPERKADGEKPARQGLSVSLSADADVWVCLLDASGSELIDGQVLTAGSQEGPFRSASFTVAFGNGQVAMEINGEQAAVEETPNPIGYAIGRSGKLRALDEGERPTCT